MRTGHNAQALEYFKKALVEEPHNPGGWLGIASLVPESAQKEYCYQKALEIDPANPFALQGLEELDVTPKQADPELSPPLPLPPEPEQNATLASLPPQADELPPAESDLQPEAVPPALESAPETESEPAETASRRDEPEDSQPEQASPAPIEESSQDRPDWFPNFGEPVEDEPEERPSWFPRFDEPPVTEGESQPEPAPVEENSQSEQPAQSPAPENRPSEESALDPESARSSYSILDEIAKLPPDALPPLVEMPPQPQKRRAFPPAFSSEKLDVALAAIDRQRRQRKWANIIITLVILVSLGLMFAFAYLRL